MALISRLLPFLSGWKLWLWLAPSLVLVLTGAGAYLHSSGYQQGYEKAELVCAAEREAGKDEALAELLRLQKEAEARQQEILALNNSINKEVRKERETITNTIETIVERQPIIVDPDSCKRDSGIIELWNNLARAGSTPSDSHTDSGEDVSLGAFNEVSIGTPSTDSE